MRCRGPDIVFKLEFINKFNVVPFGILMQMILINS